MRAPRLTHVHSPALTLPPPSPPPPPCWQTPLLHELNLSYTRVSDEGLGCLEGALPALRWLSLDSCEVGDAGEGCVCACVRACMRVSVCGVRAHPAPSAPACPLPLTPPSAPTGPPTHPPTLQAWRLLPRCQHWSTWTCPTRQVGNTQ